MNAPARTEATVSAGLRSNKWFVVGLLWLCGFLNYADRQAVSAVFPMLGDEFRLSPESKGAIGTSFSLVYALSAPFAGFLVDRLSRRRLIIWGLAVWSAICAATGLARTFGQLLVFRGLEGLGESFYFPASMSLLADHHGSRTRSRAMSLHQTSVYGGTALGMILAGYLGQRYGWRSPFWILGILGVLYALVLPRLLVEPQRERYREESEVLEGRVSLTGNLARILREPAALLLLAVFAGANFVALTLLTWLPEFVKGRYGYDLTSSNTVAGLFFPGGNAVGALCGGALADHAARRTPGGRVMVQAAGLLLGAPCVYLAGTTGSIAVLIPALVGIGLGKGIYDANIFASVYDVVRPEVRGTAAGLMNTVGWAAASPAPALVGWLSRRHGLGGAIALTAMVYLAAGLLAAATAVLAARRSIAGKA
jgi:MFS family permease